MRKPSILPVAIAAISLTVSCIASSNDGDPDKEFYGYFLRDVDTMQQMGLPVYWLGREFIVGESTFRGPYGVKFGGEVESGGIRMGYDTWPQGTPFEGPTVQLGLTVYSPEAWEIVEDSLLNPTPPPPGDIKPTKETVLVQGHEAQLISVPQIRRPTGRLRLVVELDPVVVVAEAASGGPVTPDGPDYSPFINAPDLLVQVMQHLRPYPE